MKIIKYLLLIIPIFNIVLCLLQIYLFIFTGENLFKEDRFFVLSVITTVSVGIGTGYLIFINDTK